MGQLSDLGLGTWCLAAVGNSRFGGMGLKCSLLVVVRVSFWSLGQIVSEPMHPSGQAWQEPPSQNTFKSSVLSVLAFSIWGRFRQIQGRCRHNFGSLWFGGILVCFWKSFWLRRRSWKGGSRLVWFLLGPWGFGTRRLVPRRWTRGSSCHASSTDRLSVAL